MNKHSTLMTALMALVVVALMLPLDAAAGRHGGSKSTPDRDKQDHATTTFKGTPNQVKGVDPGVNQANPGSPPKGGPYHMEQVKGVDPGARQGGPGGGGTQTIEQVKGVDPGSPPKGGPYHMEQVKGVDPGPSQGSPGGSGGGGYYSPEPSWGAAPDADQWSSGVSGGDAVIGEAPYPDQGESGGDAVVQSPAPKEAGSSKQGVAKSHGEKKAGSGKVAKSHGEKKAGSGKREVAKSVRPYRSDEPRTTVAAPSQDEFMRSLEIGAGQASSGISQRDRRNVAAKDTCFRIHHRLYGDKGLSLQDATILATVHCG